MTRLTDRAIAQAFWEAANSTETGWIGKSGVLARASEIDAAAPEVDEAMVERALVAHRAVELKTGALAKSFDEQRLRAALAAALAWYVENDDVNEEPGNEHWLEVSIDAAVRRTSKKQPVVVYGPVPK